MPETNADLLETNIVGPHTVQWGLGAAAYPSLARERLGGIGVSRPGPGYHIVRLSPAFDHVNVCLEGVGSYLIDGRWTDLEAGQAIVAPHGRVHGARCVEPRNWRMAWVIFASPWRPIPASFDRTTIVTTPVAPWEAAFAGFRFESLHGLDAAHLDHWAALLRLLSLRLFLPSGRDSRLTAVWDAVDSDLAADWTAARLADLAGMSEVHLRRLCRAELGRSPLEQVAWLRVRRAEFLLDTTAESVESVAWSVGYASPSAFTAAFKKLLKRSPRRGPRDESVQRS